MNKKNYLLLIIFFILTLIICISVGSVNIPLSETMNNLGILITGGTNQAPHYHIIATVRTPRVLTTALVGMALSLSGAVMQGLLKNPLADGTTLGVSAGASLGAVIAIVTGFSLPFLPYSGTVVLAVFFAFLSLIFILSFSYYLDHSLTGHTIILMGIIFTMFVNSFISLLLVFFQEQLKEIIFWTMGSLAGSTYENMWMLLITLVIFGGLVLYYAEELNAFSLGEEQAQNIGVDVKRVRLTLLFCVAAMIGVSVAIGGAIGFVGLVVPHMTRMLTGPNHKKLLPVTIAFGGIFLMLTDLIARTIASPIELPIGVITSFIGAIVFISIFFRNRRKA